MPQLLRYKRIPLCSGGGGGGEGGFPRHWWLVLSNRGILRIPSQCAFVGMRLHVCIEEVKRWRRRGGGAGGVGKEPFRRKRSNGKTWRRRRRDWGAGGVTGAGVGGEGGGERGGDGEAFHWYLQLSGVVSYSSTLRPYCLHMYVYTVKRRCKNTLRQCI